ncbi:hypothetical protein SAMN03159496_05981 [Rhizobium sp. NFR07]|nr:hypothetical protein SAMN03159496_05981 [Rhizobium sp. NFR07]
MSISSAIWFVVTGLIAFFVFDPNETCTMREPVTWDEAERSAALQSYEALDTPREADFDDLARVGSET